MIIVSLLATPPQNRKHIEPSECGVVVSSVPPYLIHISYTSEFMKTDDIERRYIKSACLMAGGRGDTEPMPDICESEAGRQQ